MGDRFAAGYAEEIAFLDDALDGMPDDERITFVSERGVHWWRTHEQSNEAHRGGRQALWDMIHKLDPNGDR